MTIHTLDLFDPAEINMPLERRIADAKSAITRLFMKGIPVVLAYSGGRDSGVVASLALSAARELAAKSDVRPWVIVTTGDTLVENPEIVRHYRTEHRKMCDYGRSHGFRVTTKIVRPNLLSTFQCKILSGRGIPSYAGTQTDCTEDLKLNSQRAFRSALFSSLQGEGLPEPVTLLGTRYAESERRAMNMRLRRENPDDPVKNSDDEFVLSPIAWWSTDDLTEYMGLCASGLLDSFTDFRETNRIYSHSAGTSCSVVADAILDGGKKRRKGGCGARHGCWTCQQAEDRSLENMIAFDPQYAYARGLNRFNKFLRNIRYDWSHRHWVGRTIRGGYISIQPDTFHPRMLRMLTRFLLQLDYDEMMRARKAGEERRFVTLPAEMMIAVDALQSLNGVARPFAIWADYRDIFLRGIRYDIPDIDPVPQAAVPDARFLYVGEEWDTVDGNPDWTGRRNPYWEALTEGAGCQPELVPLQSGVLAWSVKTEKTFSVDQESAAMIVDFELENLFRMYDQGVNPGGITFAYLWYLQYGCLHLSHSQREEHDMVARRTAFKDRLGLTLEYDIDVLLKMSIGFANLPAHARQAWSNKRTTTSTQTELELAA